MYLRSGQQICFQTIPSRGSTKTEYNFFVQQKSARCRSSFDTNDVYDFIYINCTCHEKLTTQARRENIVVNSPHKCVW